MKAKDGREREREREKERERERERERRQDIYSSTLSVEGVTGVYSYSLLPANLRDQPKRRGQVYRGFGLFGRMGSLFHSGL